MFRKLIIAAAVMCVLTACSSKPLPPDSDIASAISHSDDYGAHSQAFMAATKQLLKSGTCTLHDFQYMGGWVRSPNYKTEPVYFTYCGAMRVSNRIYLNTDTGKTFK